MRVGHASDPPQAPDVAELTEMLAAVDTVELGARIKRARLAKSLKQVDLADGCVSTAYVSRIESGQRRADLKVLTAIAARLDTTPHELLLGLTPKAWSARAVELDWAQLALRTGDATGALARTTGILADLPPESRLYRRAVYTHALALEATGDYVGATEHLEDLVESSPAEVDPALYALTALSRCYREIGELGRAIEVGRRAESRIEASGLEGTPEAVRLILTVAAAYCEIGDPRWAAKLCQKALVHAEALPSANERAGCYWNSSVIESRLGNHEEAVMLAQRAIFVLDEADSTRNTARLRTQLGTYLLRLDPPRPDEALPHLRQAELEMRTSDASPADRAENRLVQARARFVLGDLRAARTQAGACLRDVATSAPLVAAGAHVLLGQIAFKQRDVEAARSHYRDAILVLSGIGADRGAAQLWYDLGGLWMAVGCASKALDAFRRAGASTGLRTDPVIESLADQQLEPQS